MPGILNKIQVQYCAGVKSFDVVCCPVSNAKAQVQTRKPDAKVYCGRGCNTATSTTKAVYETINARISAGVLL